MPLLCCVRQINQGVFNRIKLIKKQEGNNIIINKKDHDSMYTKGMSALVSSTSSEHCCHIGTLVGQLNKSATF